MKKRITIVSVGTIVILVILFICYLERPFYTYVDRKIKSYTGINTYSIIQTVHKDEECYAKISINETDGDHLFKLYPLKKGYIAKVMAGKVQQNYIKDCSDCWYYMDDKGQSLYGYTLLMLSEDKKQLEIYQCFGE